MKRKNKRGFTLIELLAVIVILAIIALIAVPIILNMINSARKSAAKSSALGYIDSIEYYAGFNQISSDTGITGYDTALPEMTEGKVTCTKTSSGWNSECSAFFTAVDKKAKGKKPAVATIILSSTGKVLKDSKMTFNGYEVNYDGKDITIGNESSSDSSSSSESTSTFGGTKVNAGTNDTHKGIVYLNPTDLSATCNKELADANVGSSTYLPTGIKTGCMKFYIYDDSNNQYKMILDHNTTATVAYETSGTYKEYEQATIKSTVDSDTTGWVGNPRLITAEEVATITNSTTFNGSSNNWFYFDGTGPTKQTQASSTQGASPYAWLFDYTYECTSYGCDTVDSSTSGYWTSSLVSHTLIYVFGVTNNGNLLYSKVDIDGTFGVRPVITLSQSEVN